MAMKVSLFSTGFSNWPIERTFAAAAANGFDGVDIGGFRPHGYALDILGDVADIRTRILACVEKYQMPIVSYVPENTGSPHSFVFQDKALNEISVEYFKSTVDAAKAIGAPLLMLAVNMPGFGWDRETLKALNQSARIVRNIIAVGFNFGINICGNCFINRFTLGKVRHLATLAKIISITKFTEAFLLPHKPDRSVFDQHFSNRPVDAPDHTKQYRQKTGSFDLIRDIIAERRFGSPQAAENMTCGIP